MFNLKQIKHIWQNNKGSAVLTVVVSMVFVMALGAALLFAAYTGYSIEITQRADKANFYDASSSMDDMRLGVQTLLSESIASAYTSVLSTYITDSKDPDYDPQANFNSTITYQLFSKIAADTNNTHYFTSATTYSPTAMATFIDAPVGTAVTVTGDGTPSEKATFKDAHGAKVTVTGGTLSVNPTTSAITIKGLSVQYINTAGFESDVTSDITISMPTFFASSSVTSSINNYAIIADTGVACPGSGRAVSGSVYVGSGGVSLSVGSTLALSGGNLISKGPVSVGDNSSINFNASTNELWASEITVGDSCTVSLDGNVYVADDLVLDGTGAKVTLQKTYFGFGNSPTISAESSSIVINGRGNTPSTLNISELDKLSLAGISFIDYLDDNSKITPIPMGESMSVKSNQLAYLVPVSCISNYATNPYYFDDAVEAPTIDTSKVLWNISGTDKTLTDYIGTPNGTTYSKCEIKTLYKNLTGTSKIAYVFLVFKDKTSANAYFKDYFTADPTKISQYLSLYVTLSDNKAKTNTAGNTFYTTAGGTLALNTASDSVWASGAQAQYENMTSPYTKFVNANKIANLGSTPLEFVLDGKTVAVVANADYPYTGGSPNTIRLIISSGDVTISSSEYNGIVMAGGNVTLNGNVTSALLDTKLLDATCTVDSTTTYTLSDFLNNSNQFIGNSSTRRDAWSLDSLVSFENWAKN